MATWTTTEQSVTWTAVDDPSVTWTVNVNPTVTGGGGGVTLGETSTTAYRGDRGKTAYDHSQIVTGNPHGTTAADVGAQPSDSDLTAIAALSPSNDDFLQRKAGAWTNRTIAQVKTDLGVVSPVHQQQPKFSTNDTWAVPGQSSQYTNFGSFQISANTIYYVPFIVPSAITVTAIAIPLTAGNNTGNLRLGIYAADADWQPTGEPLLDSGAISTSTVAVKSATGLSVSLQPGRYLRCVVSDLAAWSTRAGSHGNGFVTNGMDGIWIRWRGSLTYGALPSTPTAWTTADNNTSPSDPIILLRWTT